MNDELVTEQFIFIKNLLNLYIYIYVLILFVTVRVYSGHSKWLVKSL